MQIIEFRRDGDGFHAVRREYINFTDPLKVTPGGVTVDEPVSETPLPGGPVHSQELYDAAIAQAKADNGELEVDPDASYSSYEFGSAGGMAVAGVVGFGIAASIAGLGGQQERIEALRDELQDLDRAIQQQLANQAQAEAAIEQEVREKGGALFDTLKAISDLPSIGVADPALAVADGQLLLATPDPFLALRLARSAKSILQSPADRLPPPLDSIGIAAVRQADVESALGNGEDSASYATWARTIADVGVGLDPVTGVVRSAYELYTGRNLITGEELGDVERGLAALNLITIGGFATLERGAIGLAKVARVLGGARGKAVAELATRMAKWPAKAINEVMSWRKAGRAITEEAEIALKTGREVVPIGAADGWYARVMPRGAAEKLAEGGTLAAADKQLAMITDRAAIAGTSSAEEVATKLSMFEPGNPGKLVDLNDHVIVEFRMASKEPLAFIASPFGEAEAFGPAFIPGGFTAGGAPEWVIDNSAVAKGLVDKASIAWRSITFP